MFSVNPISHYLTPLDLYKEKFVLDCEVPLLGSKIGSGCDSQIVQCDIDRNQGTFFSTNKPIKCIKEFDEVENAVLKLITSLLIVETVQNVKNASNLIQLRFRKR